MIEDETKKNFLHHHRTINAVLPPKISCKGVLTQPFDILYYTLKIDTNVSSTSKYVLLIFNFRIVLNEQKHCRLTVMPIIQNFKGTFAKLMQKGSKHILFCST